ncbi:hypothetical protein F4810DRAFT_707801 [Camillea tinctor]|nr:hypothetical protein F4810DRAFT_707801 [Camillea tinctor]
MESLGLAEAPNHVPPPISSNHVLNFDPATIRQDALATRIIIHSRYPALVSQFIEHKRRHGSPVEKALYAEPWTWQEQVVRMVRKRALVFMNPHDYTVTRDGQRLGPAAQEWDRVGTAAESRNATPLALGAYLSYDEMLLGSLLGVSGPSFFVNEGRRNNRGRPAAAGSFEPRGIVVGLVGARFERRDRMDASYILPPVANPRQHPALRALFRAFFGGGGGALPFDADAYRGRVRVTAELLLAEANARAADARRKAYVHIVGLGLGVWAVDAAQPGAYVEAFAEALRALPLAHIGTLDFAWVSDVPGGAQRVVREAAEALGIEVRFGRRNPADKLEGAGEGQLLVVSYAWDSNAFPGNEYWDGALSSSGDPATACMSTIGHLHNPEYNPGLLERIAMLGLPQESYN